MDTTRGVPMKKKILEIVADDGTGPWWLQPPYLTPETLKSYQEVKKRIPKPKGGSLKYKRLAEREGRDV